MRRLFQSLTKRLQAFLTQRDKLLLLVRCENEHTAFIVKTLESIDQATPDVFWYFVEEFEDPVSYGEAIVRAFQARLEALAKKLEEAGDPPWPTLPKAVENASLRPALRIQLLLGYVRERIPDLDAANVVIALLPLGIRDSLAYRAFVRELTAYDPFAPWCHHMRIVAREAPNVSMVGLSPELRASLEPSGFPSVEVYDTDFSLDALQNATREEIADPSVPVADRMQSLLMDANVDLTQKRYGEAKKKFELAQLFFGTLGLKAMLALALIGLGDVFTAAGNRAVALEYYGLALAAASEEKSYAIVLNIALILGNFYLAEKNWVEAAAHYEGAEGLASTLLNVGVKLHCLENIGVCRFLLENYAGAREAWEGGATLARAMEEPAALKRVLHRLRDMYAQARMQDAVRGVDVELARLP